MNVSRPQSIISPSCPGVTPWAFAVLPGTASAMVSAAAATKPRHTSWTRRRIRRQSCPLESRSLLIVLALRPAITCVVSFVRPHAGVMALRMLPLRTGLSRLGDLDHAEHPDFHVIEDVAVEGPLAGCVGRDEQRQALRRLHVDRVDARDQLL